MSKPEDEYFAREDAEKLHKLHAAKLKELEAKELEERRKRHWMKCPKCGWDLETIKWRAVEIEKCFQCGAIVLDDGELETLAGQEAEGGLLRSMFDLFKPAGKG